MRRVLLGGLGIALGVLGRPALAQDWPPRPATPAKQSADRGARLGRPVAVPDTAPAADSGVTPAGLLSRGQAPQPIFNRNSPVYPSYPAGAPYGGPPVYVSQNPPGTPMPGTPMPGGMPPMPGGMPPMTGGMPPMTGGMPPMGGDAAPQPRPLGSSPSITEQRDATGRPIPGATVGGPAVVYPGGTLVPSVVPGAPCPQPDMDNPLCGPGCDDPFGRLHNLGCGDRAWVSAEYLLWWTRSAQLPTLVTTGPTAETAVIPVVGGSFGQTLHGGARFGGGWWFSDSQCRGVDARFFFLGTNGTTFATNTGQFPVLVRPFVNVNPAVGAPLPVDLISAPGLASGGVAVNLQNSLWGAEVNYRRNLLGCDCSRLDAIVGYRYLNFKESLTITEVGLLTNPTPPAPLLTGTAAAAFDEFRAENNFHGGQIGLAGEIRRGRWSIDGRASVAFGTVFQSADITGGQLQLLPGAAAPTAFSGGLLALPGANIGNHSQAKFAVLPEAGVNFGYHITPNWRVFVGYNFLYVSNVLRPAGMINPNVDAARIPNFAPGVAPLPGPGQPVPVFRTTDFFAQGISFGMQFRW